MDTLLARDEEKRGLNKIFLVGILVGLAAIGAAIYLLSLRPSIEEQTNSILAGAHREGTPEFAELSKDIIISTDDRTVESPTGMGTISMFINGKIRNKGDRTIDILEISVVVVTQFNQVLRERRILVVPVQQALLEPGQTIPVTLTMDGFSKNDDRANIHWKVTAVHAK
jgi:hypothetical protein